MFITWKGRGWIVPVAVVTSLLLLDYTSGVITGDREYYANNGLPKCMAFCLASTIIYLAHRSTITKVFDEDGRVIAVKVPDLELHTCFAIPLKVWSAVLAIIGIVMLFVKW